MLLWCSLGGDNLAYESSLSYVCDSAVMICIHSYLGKLVNFIEDNAKYQHLVFSLGREDLPLDPPRPEAPRQHHPVHALEGLPRLRVFLRRCLLRLLLHTHTHTRTQGHARIS